MLTILLGLDFFTVWFLYNEEDDSETFIFELKPLKYDILNRA